MKKEVKTCRYQIGDRAYIQKPLVMGQVEELIALFGTISFSEADLDPATLVGTLGPDLYTAIAIVLREEGKALWWERDPADLGRELRWEIGPETAMEIVRDFFGCNPLSSLFAKLKRAIEDVGAAIRETGGSSTQPASASPEATSPGAT